MRKTVRKEAGMAAQDTFGTKKLAVEFFATDAPNPYGLAQNSCLPCFWSFGSGTKNCAKSDQEGRSGHFWFEKTYS